MLAEPSWRPLPSATPFLNTDYYCRRYIQTQTESSDQCHSKDTEEAKAADVNCASTSANALSHSNSNENSSVEFNTRSNLKVSSRHDLAMIFTCKVCETRSIKTVCRESYEKGVVVARCGGCKNLHLIADRLGWFGEPGSIEDLLAARGEEVRKGSVDTLNLTLEDLAGIKP